MKSPALRIEATDLQKRRQVGSISRHPVVHLITKGGYNVIATTARGPGLPEHGVLGVGSHPAIAKYMAERAFPELRFTELAKSAWHELSQAEVERGMADARAVMGLLGR